MTVRRNSRQQLEIEYRRKCVKDTWIKLGALDVTQEQIVQTLKTDYGIEVERSTVSRDLAAIKKAMQEQTPEELRVFLMAEYLFALKEAKSAWKRSLEDAVTETSEVIEVPDIARDEEGTPQVVSNQRLKAQTRKEGQSGNPALLGQAQAALKAVREMFGTDKPLKQELSGEVTVNDSLTDEDRARRILTLLDRARTRRDTPASGRDEPG